jgi:hypothetical protein
MTARHQFLHSWWSGWLLGSVVLLVAAAPAAAQLTTGSSSGSTGGLGAGSGSTTGSFLGSTGGSSGGSSSGSSFGSLTGMTSSGTSGTGSSGSRRSGGSASGTALGLSPDPTNSNPFQQNYNNPLALGNSIISTSSLLGNTIKPPAFGQATYGTVTSTPSSARGGGTTASTSSYGFGSPTPRAPAFVTRLAEPPRAAVVSQLTAQAGQVLARSSALTSRDNIQVAMAGNAIVLSGVVASERERRLAEGLVRMTPGVYAVQNRLVVQAPPAKP